MSAREFCSIASIPNLYIELDSPLVVSDITLHPTLTWTRLQDEFKIDPEIMNLGEKENWTSSPVYVRNFVFTGDEHQAFLTSQADIERFMNMLFLFKPSIGYLERGPFWLMHRNGAEITGGGRGDFGVVPKLDANERYMLDPTEYDEFITFFNSCYPYFTIGINSDLDKSVSNSYHWVSKARASILPYDRLIFLITAIESLIGSDTELTHRISHRAATILGSNSEERGKIYDKMHEYYGLRSTLLHGSLETINNSQLFDLAEMVRSMVLRFVSLSLNSFEISRKSLMKKLDRAVVDDTLREQIIASATSSFSSQSIPRLKILGVQS